MLPFPMSPLFIGACLLAVLVFCYSVLVLLLYLQQDQMIFLPTAKIHDKPSTYGMAYEEVVLQTIDNEYLYGWFLTPPVVRGTVLYLHGNGGNIATCLSGAKLFYEQGMQVLLVDYRGYGRSSGKPSEKGLYRDTAAMWHFLTEKRHVPPERIVLYGLSLGGGLGAWLAERHTSAGLMMQSTYSSIPDVARRHYPYMPTRWLLRTQINTLARMPKIRIPVLLMHNHSDRIIPAEHAEQLFAAANEPKKLVMLEGDHGWAGQTCQTLENEEIGLFLRQVLK